MKSIVKCLLAWLLLLSIGQATHAQSFQDWAWTKEPWKGSDKPYLTARVSIAKIYKAGKVTTAGLAVYQKAAAAKPSDPVARFKWGFYAFCLGLRQPDVTGASTFLYPAVLGFEQQPSPGSYQYTRLRFLMLSMILQQDPEMQELSKRLLKRDPNDYFVKFYAVRVLRNGSDANQSTALRYAHELVKQTPLEPTAHGELASTYQQRWSRHHRPADAKQAIAGYQRLLAIAKLTGKPLRRVQFNIKDLQSQLAKRKAKN